LGPPPAIAFDKYSILIIWVYEEGAYESRDIRLYVPSAIARKQQRYLSGMDTLGANLSYQHTEADLTSLSAPG